MKHTAHLLQTAALLLIAITLLPSCVNEQRYADEAETTQSNQPRRPSKKSQWQFTEAQEAMLSRVDALPIVQKKKREIDSVSNGQRRLLYHIEKDRTRDGIYVVKLTEDLEKRTVQHFLFEIDSAAGVILNPGGRK